MPPESFLVESAIPGFQKVAACLDSCQSWTPSAGEGPGTPKMARKSRLTSAKSGMNLAKKLLAKTVC